MIMIMKESRQRSKLPVIMYKLARFQHFLLPSKAPSHWWIEVQGECKVNTSRLHSLLPSKDTHLGAQAQLADASCSWIGILAEASLTSRTMSWWTTALTATTRYYQVTRGTSWILVALVIEEGETRKGQSRAMNRPLKLLRTQTIWLAEFLLTQQGPALTLPLSISKVAAAMAAMKRVLEANMTISQQRLGHRQ